MHESGEQSDISSREETKKRSVGNSVRGCFGCRPESKGEDAGEIAHDDEDVVFANFVRNQS